MINMIQILKQLEKIEDKVEEDLVMKLMSDGSGEIHGKVLLGDFDDIDELEKLMKELLK